MKILCLSRAPNAFQPLTKHGVSLTMVDSIAALMDVLTREAFNGIILDVKCLIRTNTHHKSLLYEFIDAFPTLRVNSAKDGESFIPLEDPDRFINTTCAAFKARSVRKNRRMRVILPLLLAKRQDPECRNAVKTCSIDISENGMFIFSTDDWRVDEYAWVRLVDIRDRTPILTKVRWVQPWGTGLHFPGIGAAFESIKPGQHEEFCRRFLLRAGESLLSELSSLETFLHEKEGTEPPAASKPNKKGFSLLQKENQMKSITVKGMHCEKCQSAVTEAMTNLDGVENVDVNLESGLVTFTEEKPVSDETIKDAIEKIGFDVV